MRGSSLVLAVCACASLLLAACEDGPSDNSPDYVANHGDGTVTLEWTVGTMPGTAQCEAQGATGILIAVYDDSGAAVGSYTATCDQESEVITLSPGRYSATAELTDQAGNPRTTVVDVDPFDIEADANYTIPVDFPTSSFL
jgi:hypothetical protein